MSMPLQINICSKLVQFTNHQATSRVSWMWNPVPSARFQQNQETNRTHSDVSEHQAEYRLEDFFFRLHNKTPAMWPILFTSPSFPVLPTSKELFISNKAI